MIQGKENKYNYFKTHFLLPSGLRTLYSFLTVIPEFFLRNKTRSIQQKSTNIQIFYKLLKNVLYLVPYLGMRFYTNAILQSSYNSENKVSNVYFYGAIAGGLNMLLLFPYQYALWLIYRPRPFFYFELYFRILWQSFKKFVYDKPKLEWMIKQLPKSILFTSVQTSLFFGLHASLENEWLSNKPQGMYRFAGCWLTTFLSNLAYSSIKDLEIIMRKKYSLSQFSAFEQGYMLQLFKSSFASGLILYCYEEYRQYEQAQLAKV